MSMYLKPRDKDILAFISDWGSITINQCSKIHFKHVKNNYYQSRMRLQILYKNKLIKRTINSVTREAVYFITKPITPHDQYILNVYAELIYSGVEILNFELERSFIDSKYFVDGFIEFTTPINGKEKQHHAILYEVDLTHKSEFERTCEIHESYEMQMYFREKYEIDKDKFPTFLICSAKVPSKPKYSKDFKIVYSNFTLEGLLAKVTS